jgi:cytochrome c biogenesis protein CcmG, thiol:disulfide interchange protein DsbE
MKRLWIVIIIAGIAIVAVSAFQYLTRPGKGDAAPLFALTSSEGKSVALEGYRGRPVLLHFWASWCSPCREEFPLLAKLAADLREEDIAVLGVAEDDEGSRAAMLSFVQEVRPPFLVLQDGDGRVADAYESWTVPESFLIDRQGTIQWRHAGPVDWSSPAIRARLERLMH